MNRSSSVLFCALSFSPVHYEHMAAIAQPIKARGYKIHFLLNRRYQPFAENEFSHTYMAGGKSGLELIWILANFVIWEWWRVVRLLRKEQPAAVFFQTTSLMNPLLMLLAKRILA